MTGDASPGLPIRRSDSVGERRFGEEEVRAILERAAAQGSRATTPSLHDPTLADLMAAAAEVGIDPADVRRAAALVPQDAGGRRGILGPPLKRRVLLTLEGTSMPADQGALARAVERAVGSAGTVEKDPKGRFVWHGRSWEGGTEVVLAPAGDALEVRVAGDRGGHAAALWLAGISVWALLLAATPLGALPLVAKALGFLAAPAVVALPFRSAADGPLRRRVEGIALEVARAAEEPEAKTPNVP